MSQCKLRLLTLVMWTVVVAGCADDGGGGTIVVDTIGGIPWVMNPTRGALGDTVPWQLTQYLLVAGDQLYDRKSARYALDVGILPNGNVLVLDTENQRILRFGADGEYLDSFGGAGSEPGQFATPLFLEVAGERIYVLDSGLNRVTVFDSAGIFLSRFDVDLAGLAGTTPLFAVGGSDEIYVAAEPVPFLDEVRDTGEAVIYRLDGAGAIADTLASFPPATWMPLESESGRVSYVRPRFAPTPRLSAKNGLTALVTTAPYLIQLRRPDGGLVRQVARQYDNVVVTPEIRDSVLDLLEQSPRSLPRQALELIPFAPVVPAVESLVLDDEGRLWVDPYSPDPRRRDVFDGEGRYLGSLHMPQPVELRDVRGDRACGTIGEVSGQSAVVCYRVSRPR